MEEVLELGLGVLLQAHVGLKRERSCRCVQTESVRQEKARAPSNYAGYTESASVVQQIGPGQDSCL